jgi:hypothetical protein
MTSCCRRSSRSLDYALKIFSALALVLIHRSELCAIVATPSLNLASTFPRGARVLNPRCPLSRTPRKAHTERPPSLWTMPRVIALPPTASAAPCPFPIGDSHPTTTWRDWWGSGVSANRSSEVPAAMGGRLLLNSIESRNQLELALGKRQITQLRLFRYCYHHLKCSKLSKMHSETEYHPFNHRSKYRHLDKE